jgi:hypothetical protein
MAKLSREEWILPGDVTPNLKRPMPKHSRLRSNKNEAIAGAIQRRSLAGTYE